jgi:hypothetical protein
MRGTHQASQPAATHSRLTADSRAEQTKLNKVNTVEFQESHHPGDWKAISRQNFVTKKFIETVISPSRHKKHFPFPREHSCPVLLP